MVRSRSKQGFTMIELMMVVLIIGVMAMLMGPGLAEFVADARAASASEDLLRVQRHVRARVMETGLAHLLRYSGTASNGLGTVTVWEGMNNHCTTTPWNSALTNGAANNHFPVEQLNMANYNPTSSGAPRASDSDRQVIRLTAEQPTGTALAAIDLCFQPNGLTLQGTAGTTWAFAPHQTTVKFIITRYVSTGGTAVQHGLTREVIFPPGGNARHRI